MENEVKNMQKELEAVQKERKHLEHHRRLLCAQPPCPGMTPPCMPPPCVMPPICGPKVLQFISTLFKNKRRFLFLRVEENTLNLYFFTYVLVLSCRF